MLFFFLDESLNPSLIHSVNQSFRRLIIKSRGLSVNQLTTHNLKLFIPSSKKKSYIECIIPSFNLSFLPPSSPRFSYRAGGNDSSPNAPQRHRALQPNGRGRRSGGIRLETSARRRIPPTEEGDVPLGPRGKRVSDRHYDGRHPRLRLSRLSLAGQSRIAHDLRHRSLRLSRNAGWYGGILML